MPEQRYWPADESVTEVATALINEHHPHLNPAEVVFLFRAKAAKRGGRIILGKASKANAKVNAYLGRDLGPEGNVEPIAPRARFVIEIAHNVWTKAPARARAALVDHELCHCTVNEEGKSAMVGHDVEEFTAIVERHGAWTQGLVEMFETAKQLDLFADGATAEADDFSWLDGIEDDTEEAEEEAA